MISNNELIPVLQMAIGPMILVSGVGLLLLTMTNRLARVLDRSRMLAHELHSAFGADRERILEQLRVFARRGNLIRWSIMLASISALFAALLVIMLFFTALLKLEDAWLLSLLFVACMVSLIGSLIAFTIDVNQSLLAIRVELDQIIRNH